MHIKRRSYGQMACHLLLLAAVCWRVACSADTKESPIRVGISAAVERTILLPDMLGTSTLPTVDTKSDYRTYNLPALFNEAGISALRFPGGTIGDNYLWNESRLQRWEGYPTKREPGKVSDPDWSDYATLLATLKQTPHIHTVVLVANFDGAFRVGKDGWYNNAKDAAAGIEKMAALAKAWAQDLRQHLGPNYTLIWELGSETYFGLGTNFDPPLAPAEYAKALKVFYREIKAGDPASIIAATGPLDRNGQSRLGHAFMYTWSGENADFSSQDWWAVVTHDAGCCFDQATFHNYKSMRVVKGRVDFTTPIPYTEIVRRAVDFIRSRAGKPITVSFTEFNGSDEGQASRAKGMGARLTGLEHVLDMSEQMGDYFEGGADLLLYWGFHTDGYKHPLVSKQPDENGHLAKLPPFYMMELWSQTLRPAIHAVESSDPQALYVLATANPAGTQYGVFLINRTLATQTAVLHLDKLTGIAAVQGTSLCVPHKQTADKDAVDVLPAQATTDKKQGVTVQLCPRSLTTLIIDAHS